MIDEDFASRRERMVASTIEARGVHAERVLAAMREVPRERFLPEEMAEFAYQDTPLPIEAEQTISQPYIVAAMAAAAELGPGDRVLEVGTGSGYGAAVLSRIAARVDTIERHEILAETASERLAALGYDNVTVLVGDGTLGWPDGGPFDAIVVTAAAPTVPQALLAQMADGGRLVVPVGEDTRGQALVRLRRVRGDVVREDLGPVRFVPLIGAQGFHPASSVLLPEAHAPVVVAPPSPSRLHGVTALVAEAAHPFASIETAELAPLLERIGDASVVLLGEASHGTSEFYRMRDRITRALIEHKGFTMVAVEADWPDAARLDAYVRGREPGRPGFRPFTRFRRGCGGTTRSRTSPGGFAITTRASRRASASASTASTCTASTPPGTRWSTISTGSIPMLPPWPGGGTAASPPGSTNRPSTGGPSCRGGSPAARPGS